jgi:hypothetical protein
MVVVSLATGMVSHRGIVLAVSARGFVWVVSSWGFFDFSAFGFSAFGFSALGSAFGFSALGFSALGSAFGFSAFGFDVALVGAAGFVGAVDAEGLGVTDGFVTAVGFVGVAIGLVVVGAAFTKRSMSAS